MLANQQFLRLGTQSTIPGWCDESTINCTSDNEKRVRDPSDESFANPNDSHGSGDPPTTSAAMDVMRELFEGAD